MSGLCDMNTLQKHGAFKNARFSLIPGADYFIKAPHVRPKVRYEVERISNYKPNVTTWLTGSALARMHDAVAESKRRHSDNTSMAASRRAAERFLIDLSWASSSLEGSTYEYLDTVALISYGQKAKGGTALDSTLILNHKRAIAFMMEAISEKQDITVEFISRIHALLMRDILEDAELGTIRTIDVNITASAYHPSSDGRILQASLAAIVERMNQIEDPCEAATFVLNSVSYLQAFTDGNKRTARLLANIPLLKAGCAPLSFIDVDKTAYLAGLIAFYELGDLSLINNTVASAYEAHAPSYEAAILSPNTTRTVEMRERRRIDNCIGVLAQSLVGSKWSDDLIVSTVVSNFMDLDDDEQAIIIESIRNTFNIISPNNSCAWDITPEVAANLVKVRDLHKLGVDSPESIMSMF
jgi:fido (protein-threonine AMPylation protein)